MKNFGKIKNHIINSLTKSYINESLQEDKNLKKFLDIVKESEILRTEFSIYKNLENYSNTKMGSEYLDANISLIKKYAPNEIISEHKKLIELFGIEKLDEVDPKQATLYESITNLIFLENGVNTVNKLVEAKGVLLKQFNDNDIKRRGLSKTEIKDQKILSDIAKQKIKEKFEGKISEDELKIVNAIIKGDETLKETIYKDLVKECLEYVNGEITSADIDRKEKLLNVKAKLLESTYNSETFKEDAKKVITLLEGFKK